MQTAWHNIINIIQTRRQTPVVAFQFLALDPPHAKTCTHMGHQSGSVDYRTRSAAEPTGEIPEWKSFQSAGHRGGTDDIITPSSHNTEKVK